MVISDNDLENIRVVLALLTVLAGVAVWGGVYLENDNFSEETKDMGWKLLLRGLAVETASTFLLLVVDTTISIRQRSEIALLEAKIAPRRLTGEQKRAISMAPPDSWPKVIVVSRLLDAEGKDFADDFSEALKGANWDIGPSSVNWTRSDKGLFIGAVGQRPFGFDWLAHALDAANIKYTVIEISSKDTHQNSPWFQPGVIYLLIGAKP